jgi:vesicular inhibitory amino acid transporter
MECLKAKEGESHNQLPLPEEPHIGTTFLRTCFNGLNALSGLAPSSSLPLFAVTKPF